MANLCKFDKKQYQVSYDSGVTWENVIPEQIDRGNNMIEYDSSDCSSVDTMYRWRTLDGQYLCDDKEKWTKQIQEESYNNGLTWYASYPTVYRKGTYVGIDETFCNDKFVGHYVGSGNTSTNCPKWYVWNGYKCVFVDPIKVVKCNDSDVLTNGETSYYIGNYHLISCKIGDCVTSIGDWAFYAYFYLSAITISDSVTSIGNGAFSECHALTNITIGSGVTFIDDNAFRNCGELTSVTCLATTPPTLGGNDTFIYSDKCHIYVPCESVYTYKTTEKWSNYADRIQPIESPCVPTPTGVTKVHAYYSDGLSFFKYCDSAATLTRYETKPSGYEASGMTSAEIGDCVTQIGDSAFTYCSSLTSIDIPNSVTQIAKGAFIYCTSLTSVEIPSGITYIGDSAFRKCTNLFSITINATIPPTLGQSSIDVYHVFDDTNNCPIYVPAASVNDYKQARKGWGKYSSRIQPIT